MKLSTLLLPKLSQRLLSFFFSVRFPSLPFPYLSLHSLPYTLNPFKYLSLSLSQHGIPSVHNSLPKAENKHNIQHFVLWLCGFCSSVFGARSKSCRLLWFSAILVYRFFFLFSFYILVTLNFCFSL